MILRLMYLSMAVLVLGIVIEMSRKLDMNLPIYEAIFVFVIALLVIKSTKKDD